MRVELRADGLHIEGYVNVPGRVSARPVITRKHGKVLEVIEQRAFSNAISKNGNIKLLLDHDPGRVLASTGDGSLMLKEDRVGLRAEAVITDAEVIENAQRLRGWSFDMQNIEDSIEERADGLPLRHVKAFDMTEVSLILHKNPVYSATSIEVRAEGEEEIEYRAEERRVEVSKVAPVQPDYTQFENRISEARIAKW